MIESMFERFSQQAPVAVMMRALLANVLSERELDTIFRDSAEQQVEGELLFSRVVELLHLVVTQAQPSVHAAYQQRRTALGVSAAALYQKLAGIEPAVTRELVARTACKLGAVITKLQPALKPLLPGYEVRILDGFHLASTEHRLAVTRGVKGGPLPGQALVVLDPERQLIEDILPWEDGHDQERGILADLVDVLQPGQVWVCDRNFATRMWLFQTALEQAFFVIRQHEQLPLEATAQLQPQGRVATGTVAEQPVRLSDGYDSELELRRIVVTLTQPTTAGDRELAILTNLPATVTAGQIAELYQKRWSIEAAFGELTLALRGEINTLAYPKAALLGFGLAVLTYNVLRVVRSAIAAQQGAATEEQVSTYYLANEVATTWEGMLIAIQPQEWSCYADLTPHQLARELRRMADNVDLRRYQKHPRGPKCKPPKRTGKSPHQSTARLLKMKR